MISPIGWFPHLSLHPVVEVIIRQPHSQLFLLELCGHQRVELQTGSQPCSFLALELYLQHRLPVGVAVHDLYGPLHQLLPAGDLHTFMLQSADPVLPTLFSPRDWAAASFDASIPLVL